MKHVSYDAQLDQFRRLRHENNFLGIVATTETLCRRKKWKKVTIKKNQSSRGSDNVTIHYLFFHFGRPITRKLLGLQ